MKTVWPSPGEACTWEARSSLRAGVSESEGPQCPPPRLPGDGPERGVNAPGQRATAGQSPATPVLVGAEARHYHGLCLWLLLPTSFAQAICSAHGLGDSFPGPGTPVRVHMPRNPDPQGQGPVGRTPCPVPCSEGAAAWLDAGPYSLGTLGPSEGRRRV